PTASRPNVSMHALLLNRVPRSGSLTTASRPNVSTPAQRPSPGPRSGPPPIASRQSGGRDVRGRFVERRPNDINARHHHHDGHRTPENGGTAREDWTMNQYRDTSYR